MLTSRPYLARALYEWLLDNDQTPYIVVDAGKPGVRVPQQFVQNGQIVLNVAPAAVRDLSIDNAAVTFGARFSGQPMQVIVPTDALIAIYARENGVGMVFGQEPVMPDYASDADVELEEQEQERPTLESIEGRSEVSSDEKPEADSDDTDGKPDRGKPSLRIVK